MKPTRPLRLIALASLGLLILSGCQTSPTTTTVKSSTMAGDAACNITQASYNHIYARHCTASSGADQLLSQYCTQTGMQNFCQMVQTAPNQIRTVQPNNNIRYDSNLGQVVGTAGQKCGRLIITSAANGEVVTEFPEFGYAPGPCN